MTAGRVRLESGEPAVVRIGAIDAVGVEPGWLGSRLWLRPRDGRRLSIGGLDADDAEQLARVITGEAERVAATFTRRLLEMAAQVRETFATDRYLRHSSTEALRSALAEFAPELAARSGTLVVSQLSPDAADARALLQRLCDGDGFEREREAANDRYIASQTERASQALLSVGGFKAIPEQATAIATDEDVTLVLAGAGTGKTAVITGKVAHLTDHHGVEPESILVLAFNRKAANEIRARLGERLEGVDVSTFHAFGRHVVAMAEGAAPSIAPLAEDESLARAAVESVLQGLLADPARGNELRSFILYNLGDYRAPYEFASPSDYYEYLNQTELRTLKGERVKSMEELRIANFLALHGVRYEYEAAYPVETATREHRQYKPDFHLPDHDLYIEHFGVNRQEEPPPLWSASDKAEYRRGMAWKRELHEQYGTPLIETYSWHHREGVWRSVLENRLRDEGVPLASRPVGELLDDLGQKLTASRLSSLLLAFLHHVKASDMSETTLRERAAEASDRERSAQFLNLFAQVRSEYQKLLGDEYDFDDLISEAAVHIRSGRWGSPYRYVLVDEFQDISAGRIALLQALTLPGAAYFLVGDDWQSIYRFTGSDVGLVRQCDRRLGPVRERTLTQTFRFGDGILQPSSAFIQQNPAQTQRQLRPVERATDHRITVIWASDREAGLSQALEDLGERDAGPDASLLAMGRYRGRMRERWGDRHIEFSTVHAAKGREADYVVVFDLVDDRRGFPSQMDDDPLLDLVAPPEEPFAFAEERRLFYVALTRARQGAYLVVDPMKPSRFVSELLELAEQPVREIGSPQALQTRQAPSCPRCGGGSLIPSQSGRTLRCTHHPHCDHQARACRCGKGYVIVGVGTSAHCTNGGCGLPPPSRCPACGLGVLVERDGAYGPFWGCSRFTADPPCAYTQNREPRTQQAATHS